MQWHDAVLIGIIGFIIGICADKLISGIIRAITFTGYLVIAKDKPGGEPVSIYIDLNYRPEEIQPHRWIHCRTQEIILKEDE